MPPKKRTRQATTATPKCRLTRRKQDIGDEIPEVYQEMLAEAVAAEAATPAPPRKRRKVSEEPHRNQSPVLGPSDEAIARAQSPPRLEREGSRLQQIVLDDFSASSEDEEVDFEDVDIGQPDDEDGNSGPVEQKSLQIDLSRQPLTPNKVVLRRRIATPAERALRLSVHKTHLLLLLLSISVRNRWCENPEVQAILKPLAAKKIINQLHVDESEPQWKRSIAFNEAIKEICQIWRTTFQLTIRGMRRAIWRSDIDISREIDEAEDILDLDDFKAAAQTRSGSRDLGVQLLCALLRSCAVDTRLVCSLQVLPFSAAATQESPQKPIPKASYTQAPAQDFGSSTSASRRKKLNESPYPVFWVEVFSSATSNWFPLDPLVRNSINKPKTGFEPPASDQLNAMSYVIAFEDDGTARDVTRRYAQWFNAKTRKTRVESTKGGEAWYGSVMKFFEKRYKENRDAIEDAELARRNEIEGMPKNVQDFKGHPFYVLERHLRRNEVIYPRKEAGKVPVGAGHKSSKLEPVFRRRDVHVCRSADAWYRRGRDVRFGETPLKRATAKKREAMVMDVDGEATEDDEKALYAEFQTDLYVPPSVINGKIPRNAFGNLDVYVPSMIPPGAIHVRHPLAAKAAQVLGMDYAEAVTGFEFKGRQGTAVVDGVVVAAPQRVAMVAVVVGLQSQATEETEAHRSRILLGIWKKWLAALEVKQQIARDYGDRVDDEVKDMDVDDDAEDQTYQDDDAGGGFFAEAPTASDNDAEPTLPALSLPGGKLLPDDLPPPPSYHEIIVVESPHKLPTSITSQTAQPKFSQDHEGSIFVDAEQQAPGDDPSVEADEAMSGGGFLSGDAEENGGGFMVEVEKQDANTVPAKAGSPLALDVTGGGFTVERGGFEVDAEASVEVAGEELKVEDSWHDKRHSMDRESSPAPDEAAQAQMAAQAIPASSIDVSVPPQHLPAGLTAGGSNPVKSAVPPKGPDVAVLPASTQSSLSDEAADEEDRMSHDPEEDEAEPEWLHDSLGMD